MSASANAKSEVRVHSIGSVQDPRSDDAAETEDRLLRLIATAVPDYGRRLTRLAGDFSTAVAFLLSDPVFDRLGLQGREFVEYARQAYSGGDCTSPIRARLRCLELARQSDAALRALSEATAERRAALDDRRRHGEKLSLTAQHIRAEAEQLLAAQLSSAPGDESPSIPADPEKLADHMVAAANRAFEHMREAWRPIYGELTNSTLPPAPLLFSGRQMYIETVKVFNQYRLNPVEPLSSEGKGLRGLFGAGRRSTAKEVAEARAHAAAEVVASMHEAILAALDAWQRSAQERIARRGVETDASVSEETLKQELAVIGRAVAGLTSLKRELARGLSVRQYYLALLQRAAGCSGSA